jgi:hypothetical protein
MASANSKLIRKKIKIDIETGLNDCDISTKYREYNITEARVRMIRKRRPPICKDADFKKYELIRELNCLSEYERGNISGESLNDIFSKASKLISEDTKGYKYRNLIYPLEPREWEMRHAICDVLSELKFNYLIECPIKNPIANTNKRDGALWTDISILSKKGIIDIEIKDSRGVYNIRQDFKKLLSAPDSTVGTACFFLCNDNKFEESKLKEIISEYVKAYDLEHKNLQRLNVRIYYRWFLFFLFSFKEKFIFNCFFDNINEVTDEWKNKSSICLN